MTPKKPTVRPSLLSVHINTVVFSALLVLIEQTVLAILTIDFGRDPCWILTEHWTLPICSMMPVS